MCPPSCQDDISCLIAACSDCALVDIVCDEDIDTTAYPQLATSQGLTYADLDLADVPADKKAQSPYGDSGLFDVMNASATCYQTQASISEADLVDYKANPKQCAIKPISAAAATGPAISAVLALVGAVALRP